MVSRTELNRCIVGGLWALNSDFGDGNWKLLLWCYVCRSQGFFLATIGQCELNM
jgi:REP element-mobilizing transposase RayT